MRSVEPFFLALILFRRKIKKKKIDSGVKKKIKEYHVYPSTNSDWNIVNSII